MGYDDKHRADLAGRADIEFRKRALQTNCGIHSRRHGPALLPLFTGTAIQTRYSARMAWLGSEAVWQASDARAICELADAIARFGRGREPEVAETCEWHAARLRELVGQHAALHRRQLKQRSATFWPESAAQIAPKLRKAVGSGGRR